MRKLVLLATSLLITAILLTGCASHFSGKGTVVSRSYTDAWTQVIMIPCGQSMCPMVSYYPEAWYLGIIEGTETAVTSYSVDQNTYENVHDGAIVEIREGTIIEYKNT